MSGIVTALRAELKELTLALQADPRYRRMRMIRDLLADYEPKGPKPPTLFDQAEPAADIAAGYHIDLTTGSKADRIKTALTAFLKEKGSAHRKDLLEHLKGLKIMGAEGKPMQALAIYLVGWKDTFESNGKGIYSLKQKTPA